MGEIYLVRHGQASFGTDDYDRLSERGIEQSRQLGDWLRLRGLRFNRILVGDMLRHRQTLDHSGYGDGEVEVLPGLNEYDFHTLVDCHVAQFPTQPAPDLSDPRAFYRQLRFALGAWADGSLQATGCESWAEFETRVGESLRALTRADVDRVLAISSGGAITALVRAVLGLSVDQMITMNLQMTNTGITRLMFKGDKVRLQSWNATPHLELPDTQHLLSYT